MLSGPESFMIMEMAAERVIAWRNDEGRRDRLLHAIDQGRRLRRRHRRGPRRCAGAAPGRYRGGPGRLVVGAGDRDGRRSPRRRRGDRRRRAAARACRARRGRRGRAAGPAVERHPVGEGRRRPGTRAGRTGGVGGRGRLGAGRELHRDQAALARRARAQARRAGRRGAAAARLADLAAARRGRAGWSPTSPGRPANAASRPSR